MKEEAPVFPITVEFLETGEVSSYDSLKDLECNLEWFDSDDPDENAIVRDKLGRRVRLKIEYLKALEFHLEDRDL